MGGILPQARNGKPARVSPISATPLPRRPPYVGEIAGHIRGFLGSVSD
jgi:hypothetical protein